MLDDATFKIVSDSTPLISIDILLKKSGKVLLGKRVNKPAQGYSFPLVVELIKTKLLIMQWRA